MTILQISFIIIAAATLGTAILVVVSRNLIHSALWLIGTLFGVAVLFVILNAGFLAVVQVTIYIGAITILMIFAIMLTSRITKPVGAQLNSNWIWGLLIALLMFGSITWILSGWTELFKTPPVMRENLNTIQELGVALVSPQAYLIAFEIASVLLLAALIGAIYVAWDRNKES
jgi:NADH-quinone oxidoreductase subunit J